MGNTLVNPHSRFARTILYDGNIGLDQHVEDPCHSKAVRGRPAGSGQHARNPSWPGANLLQQRAEYTDANQPLATYKKSLQYGMGPYTE